MGNKLVYEYVVVKDWLENLEKGTRLYYDYNENGYVYHYEVERTNRNSRCTFSSSTVEDYFISLDIANNGITIGTLIAGPELGEYVLSTASSKGEEI